MGWTTRTWSREWPGRDWQQPQSPYSPADWERAADLRWLLEPYLDSGWGVSRKLPLAYRRPVGWTLRGLLLTTTAAGTELWYLHMPLYVPTQLVDLSWSVRIGGPWPVLDARDVEVVGLLGAALRGVDAPHRRGPVVLGRARRWGDLRQREVVAYARLIEGEVETAARLLARICHRHPRRVRHRWEDELLTRTGQVWGAIVSGDVSGAMAQLEVWRAWTAAALGVDAPEPAGAAAALGVDAPEPARAAAALGVDAPGTPGSAGAPLAAQGGAFWYLDWPNPARVWMAFARWVGGGHPLDLDDAEGEVDGWQPPVFVVDSDEQDLLDHPLSGPEQLQLCSPRMREVIEQVRGPEDRVQWLPAEVQDIFGRPHRYSVLHMLADPVPLWDPDRTAVVGGRPVRPVFDRDRIAGRHLFRVPGRHHAVVVSDVLRRALESVGCTGLWFRRAPVA